MCVFFFFQAEDGIRDLTVTGVQTCALPIFFAAQRPDRAADADVGHALDVPGLSRSAPAQPRQVAGQDQAELVPLLAPFRRQRRWARIAGPFRGPLRERPHVLESAAQECRDDVRERATDRAGEGDRAGLAESLPAVRTILEVALVAREEVVRHVDLHQPGGAQRMAEGEEPAEGIRPSLCHALDAAL